MIPVGAGLVMILSAMSHQHGAREIEKSVGAPVEVVPLSLAERQPLTDRDYILRVVADIHASIDKITPGSRVIFLVTGNAFFNTVAIDALRKHLDYPFNLLVYNGDGGYHFFSSELVFDLPLFSPMS